MRKFIAIFFLSGFFVLLNGLELAKVNNSLFISGDFNVKELVTKDINNEPYDQVFIDDCLNNPLSEFFTLPVYTKLVSLPSIGNYKCVKTDFSYDSFTIPNKLALSFNTEQEDVYTRDEWFPKNIINIGKPAIMREIRFSQITISPIQYNPARNEIRLIKDIEFEFTIENSDTRNPLIVQPVNSIFTKLTSEKIFGTSANRTFQGGSYLFIAPDNAAAVLQPLLRWKEKLGFNTKLALLSETGSTADEIKAYLQDAYDSWDIPPEFVVLVGDVSGNYQCPAFYVEGYLSPWNVTDHNYTLLAGDDYFPDILLGRISVQSQSELQTIISKIINYEQNPFTEIQWQNRALMVGFVQDWNGYSQRETLMEIRNKLLNFEYSVVDTFIAPWQQGQTQLASSISAGESFVCYRGTGSPTNWGGSNGSMFTLEDIDLLDNGFMLPMITSITCGGGDFATEQAASSFGEKWVLSGSPAVPRGAIGFIGPSEHDTKTWFNNAYAIGVYQGITQEGLFRCGEMLLRGKMELYNNYPNSHSWGNSLNSDQFYFYVYNLLGDPGLQIFTDIPKEIDVVYNTQITSSENFIEIRVETSADDPSGFTIALTSEDSLITTGITDTEGLAVIPIDLPEGSYEITASNYGYIPESGNLMISSETDIILEDYYFSEQLISGSIVNLYFTITNISQATYENLILTFVCSDDHINISNSTINVDLLETGQSLSDQINLQLSPSWSDGTEINLFLEVVSNENEHEFLIQSEIISPKLSVSDIIIQNESNCLIQNQETDMAIQLTNIGNFPSGDFEALLTCTNDNVEVINSACNFTDIQQQESALGFFTVFPGNVNSGEIGQFNLDITDDGETLQQLNFEIPIGIIDSTSITYSLNGYYAVESSDNGDFEIPEYNWIEIDPNYGGDGLQLDSDHTIPDGFTKVIPLPFQFNYFGTFYDQISICSEGYISVATTPLVFHRNRNIPSGVGPSGMIAPFWDNLEDGRIYVKYDEDNNYMIIEWSDFVNLHNGDAEIFQVILYDPEYYFTPTKKKLIKFQYKEIHNTDQEDNFATVGLENFQQNEGLLITFADVYPTTVHQLQSETAIIFYQNGQYDLPFISILPDNFIFSVPSDSTFSADMMISNSLGSSEISYSAEISHFAKIPTGAQLEFNEEFSRSIANTMIFNMTNTYIPIEPMNFLFYLIHNDIDGEAVNGITIDFPPGFHVNSASDVSDLSWNNETGDGAEVSWGYQPGVSIAPTFAVAIIVNVTIDEEQVSPVNIAWAIQGDGSGEAPHQVSGSFVVNPTTDNYFWITYPNGGETVVPSLQDTIKWDKYGNAEFVKLLLSRQGGQDLETIAASADNNGAFPYIFDGPLSDDCIIKVSTLDNSVYDVSDSVFCISAFNITHPNQNTILSYGTIDTIRWQETGIYDNVKIEISTNNGFSWNLLEENASNTGSYVYNVPGPPSEYCILRISEIDGSVKNTSQLFTIVDSPVNWLSLENPSGIIPSGGIVYNTITFCSDDLTPDIYVAVIKITTDIGQILNIPITMEVYANIPPVEKLSLSQNYPNPFNPFTKIDYKVPQAGKISIKIYNASGQYVKTLVNDFKQTGEYYTYWDGTDERNRKVSSGVYFYQLNSNKSAKAKKMILIK
ncbi:MAG: T9SS type A sorting domain-containing protein [Candidatus Cloacimonetes bacterium]|nr:T9SS type A sorting domain-containing protein [Candidatus Cloacimonadota bacterium]